MADLEAPTVEERPDTAPPPIAGATDDETVTHPFRPQHSVELDGTQPGEAGADAHQEESVASDTARTDASTGGAVVNPLMKSPATRNVPPLPEFRGNSVSGENRGSTGGGLPPPGRSRLREGSSPTTSESGVAVSFVSGSDPKARPKPRVISRKDIEARKLSRQGSFGSNSESLSRRSIEITTAGPTRFDSNTESAASGAGAEMTSEDRAQADGMDQLFSQGLKREEYIPVKVARDKIKQILSEMAQMKTMHMAAIDTMEQQQKFLKSQLETAVAQYTRKLTTDYNNRVKALETEYQKRLSSLNDAAMGDISASMQRVKTDAAAVEARYKEKYEIKEQEMEQEKKILQARMEKERKELTAFAEQLKGNNERVDYYEKKIADLEYQVKSNQRSMGRSPAPGGGDSSEEMEELRRRVNELQEQAEADAATKAELEGQLHKLKKEKRKSLHSATEAREVSASLENELAAARERIEGLEQNISLMENGGIVSKLESTEAELRKTQEELAEARATIAQLQQ